MNINSINSFNYSQNLVKQDGAYPKTNYGRNNNQVSFQAGKKPGKVSRFFAEYYGKHILGSDSMRKVSEFLAKLDKKGDVTRHFQTFGSLITSSAYMHSTLKNKEFDKDNALTLAVNQGLSFILPTIAAYTVDLAIRDINKQCEYAFSAAQEKKIKAAKLAPEAKQVAMEKLGKQLKGFRTLIGIVTFTTIYRYVAPVLITPIANWIGGKINAKRGSKPDVEHKIADKAPQTERAAA